MPNNSKQNSGCLTAIVRLFLGNKSEEKKFLFPYQKTKYFLTDNELAFYQVLREVVGSQAVICSKVRMLDLLYLPNKKGHQTALNKVSSKHIDFLLCDPDNMNPIIAIELDDRSHQEPDRWKRDQEVNEIFQTAGLPLLHIPSRSKGTPDFLTEHLAPYLGNGHTPTTAPVCPKCGVPMVVKVAQKGPNAGQRFYGCPNFPECRETIAIS